MKKDNCGQIMTVRGLVPVSDMGKTITHEHLRFSILHYTEEPTDPKEAEFFHAPVSLENLYEVRRRPFDNLDNCEQYDIDVALGEVAYFRDAGGGTICDVSAEGVCKYDYAKSLVEISERSGVHIVGGIGLFADFDTPDRVKKMTADQVADYFIDQIKNGYRDYRSVKPGIIGEMGTGHVIQPGEITRLRGACRASLETGIPISVHLQLSARNGHQVLDVARQEGLDMDRIILDHVDTSLSHPDCTYEQGLDYIRSLAQRGAYVEFDLCGNAEYFPSNQGNWFNPTDMVRAKAIKALCESGCAERILTSHDAAHKYMLRKWGGWGYSHAITGFKDVCLWVGVDEKVFDGFSIDNPRRVLAIREK